MRVFQYASNRKVFCDEYNLSDEQADELWDKNISDFKKRFENGEDPEMCIWENESFSSQIKYVSHDTCTIINGILYQLVKID